MLLRRIEYLPEESHFWRFSQASENDLERYVLSGRLLAKYSISSGMADQSPYYGGCGIARKQFGLRRLCRLPARTPSALSWPDSVPSSIGRIAVCADHPGYDWRCSAARAALLAALTTRLSPSCGCLTWAMGQPCRAFYSESDKDLGFAGWNRGFSRFFRQQAQPARALSPAGYLNIYGGWSARHSEATSLVFLLD